MGTDLPFDGGRLDRCLSAAGIDLVLATSRHNVRWFLGGYYSLFFATIDAIGVGRYLPVVGYPLGNSANAFYVGNPFEIGQQALAPLWVRAVRNVAWGSEQAAVEAAAFIDELGYAEATIAVETPFLPADAYQTLRRLLPRAHFVDAVRVLEDARAVKRQYELRLLKEASEAIVDAMLATLRRARAGSTTREIADILAREEVDRGLVFDYCLAPVGTSLNRTPSAALWEYGAPLSLDSGGTRSGYIGDLARMAVLGRPSRVQTALLQEINDVQMAARDAVRPGARGGDIYRRARAALSACPHRDEIEFLAHGVGLISHEAPRLTDTGPVPYPADHEDVFLEPGMVVSIETTLASREHGYIKLEDTIAVTDAGCEACEAFASDLNPVACLILKVLLDDIPRYGRVKLEIPTIDGDGEEVDGLAEAVRRMGSIVKTRAEKELAQFYPPDPDGARPIAYLWARTVPCEAPACGAEIPLVRSFWLSKKTGRYRALRYSVDRPKDRPPQLAFEIFEPKDEGEIPKGTVLRENATCPACRTVLRVEHVRAHLCHEAGGADVVFNDAGQRARGARLLAVVTVRPGAGRRHRLPEHSDYEAVWKATAALEVRTTQRLPNGLSPVPDEPVDQWHHDVNRLPMYGMSRWGDVFTARQKLALVTLARAVRELPTQVPEAVRKALTVVVDRCADYNSANCRWVSRGEYIGNTYTRQALQMVWDFCEINVSGEDATGGFDGALDWVAKVLEAWPGSTTGQVQPADAAAQPLPNDTAMVWFTDPPYYDAIDYAHCADFFYVWLKRTLLRDSLLHDPFDPANSLTPKSREIVVDSTTTKGHGVRTPQFYENGMARACREGRRVLHEDGIGAVVFAHKTTEGWEALLSGLVRAGWVVTASWPITTEMGARLRARESAALSASVHRVLRPRPADAQVGDWDEVLRELPQRVGGWMVRLQSEGIRGADLVFACIGPALEIFSRYSRVEDAEGRAIPLGGDSTAHEPHERGYLTYVWETVGREALNQVLGASDGGGGALEEDARLTALFLWALQSTDKFEETQTAEAVDGDETESGDAEEAAEEADEAEAVSTRQPKGFILIFDVVRRFAQPLGIRLPEWEGRIIETKKGVVGLLTLRERAGVLFSREGADLVAERIEQAPRGPMQLELVLGDLGGEAVPPIRGRRNKSRLSSTTQAGSVATDDGLGPPRGATTLDRVHAAMLFQASGHANTLRALLRAEVERGGDFLRLANALSALYPAGSEEKRLLDAMLLAVPR
jgi:putative DNA methylase